MPWPVQGVYSMPVRIQSCMLAREYVRMEARSVLAFCTCAEAFTTIVGMRGCVQSAKENTGPRKTACMALAIGFLHFHIAHRN
jgi:hypothetical protein